MGQESSHSGLYVLRAFSSEDAEVRIVPVEGEEGIFHGTTFGEDGAYTRVPIGEHTTAKELDNDWIITHEFVHLALPDMPREHEWIEEGLATYVEPIARTQAGQLKPARIWRDMMRDMPQGEPQDGDEGLDNTHTWARTYLGGAMYCLRADLMIRQRTNNRKGLQDALRAIVATGGNPTKEDWTLDRALKVGDRATGTKVLEQLYAEMKDKPVQVDLTGIWQKLGISIDAGKLKFNDRDNWASARIASTQPRHGERPLIASRGTSEEQSANNVPMDVSRLP